MKKENLNTNENQNNSQNTPAMESYCADFAAVEPTFQELKACREEAKKGILERIDSSLFNSDKKSVSLHSGVIVKRSTRLSASVDQDKVDSGWLRRFLATDGAAALSVSIDPKMLRHSPEVDALLQSAGYVEKLTHSYSVILDTVKREDK